MSQTPAPGLRAMRRVEPAQVFEVHDVAEALEISPNAVRLAVLTGRLMPIAITPRGCRLFDPDEVQAFKLLREEQRSRKAAIATGNT